MSRWLGSGHREADCTRGLSTWPALPHSVALGSERGHVRVSIREPQSSSDVGLEGVCHHFHCSQLVGSKSLRPAQIQEEGEQEYLVIGGGGARSHHRRKQHRRCCCSRFRKYNLRTLGDPWRQHAL